MEKELKIKMYSFTLDCINPYALAVLVQLPEKSQ